MKKYILPVITFTILLLPGAVAHAANLPLLDPNFSIVPEACRADCPCGVGAALQFIQNIMNVLISFAVVVMSLIIAWAGFLFVMSAANPESRSKARGMLINAFIGLFIVLSAWLIVDFIMKRLYGDGSTAFGPWNKILVLDGSQCIDVNNNLGQIQGLPGGLSSVGVNGVPGGTGSSGIAVGNVTSSLSAQQAAKTLLSSSNVSSTNSISSCGPQAGATSNLQQVAAGKGMTRCPCGGGGSVAPSETLLNSLIDIANAGARFQINVIAGGCHSGNSNHYDGIATDIQRNSTLDAFFSRYPRVSCQGSKTGYRVSGEVVCFEDPGHYHLSPTGN